MDLDEHQAALLARLKRLPVVLTQADSDDDRLAMLQLYTAGCVVQLSNRAKGGAMEWHITPLGLSMIHAHQKKP